MGFTQKHFRNWSENVFLSVQPIPKTPFDSVLYKDIFSFFRYRARVLEFKIQKLVRFGRVFYILTESLKLLISKG